MKWYNTIASECRYSECAEEIFGDADIIWEDSEADYQGHVDLVGVKPDGTVIMYEYSYGSCSGCDDWENRELSNEEIVEEMKRNCISFTKNETKELKNLLQTWTNKKSSSLLEKKKAIEKYFNWR